jgi:hypothetical protein
MQKTTIAITYGTRDRLKDFGKKGDSYDDILNELMDYKEKKEGEK